MSDLQGDLRPHETPRDVCRICRGEATEEEQLFHPCKCSGSIRYVHQECLTEWLQHSQRKNVCELCKTPFKFTKLYSPDMPKRIPPLVLLTEIVEHIRDSILLYLRLTLVCFVWLGWLPLSTRYAVRFYFWVSDDMFDGRSQNATTIATMAAQNLTDVFESVTESFTDSTAGQISAAVGVNQTAKYAIFGELTNNPVVNKVLVDTFEGQVITGLFVLIFIILFLIREWVLQNAALHQAEDIPAFIEQLQAQPVLDQPVAPIRAAAAGILLRPLEVVEGAQGAEGRPDRDQRNMDHFMRQENLIVDGRPEVERNFDRFARQEIENEAEFNFEFHARNLQRQAAQQPEDAIAPYEEVDDAARPIADVAQIEAEHPDNNGFWDTVGAWFRDNVLGDEEDGDLGANEAIPRAANNADEVQRGADDELDDGGEDFDGILELIGMRGPIPVLVQNGIFSTVLVTGTLAVAIWMPYLVGKIALLLVSHPVIFFGIIPVSVISFWANQAVDIFIGLGVSVFGICLSIAESWIGSVIDQLIPSLRAHPEIKVGRDAWSRVAERFHLAEAFFTGAFSSKNVSAALIKPSWVRFIHGGELPDKTTGIDRTVAIVAGYVALTAIGAWYLSRSKRLARHRAGRSFERFIIDVLRQAGSIMKVIVIIGVELVVFPLLCGTLLDLSFIPVFDGVTIQSRWDFTSKHPIPSTFLHWFVGTLYMFHFALFVSMCREIVRPGVLYFIRDPNDPDFHPIRDVLDRPVWTQLRKIALSAVVYCSLICICLGGIIYGLRYIVGGQILPVNLNWNYTIADFPLDLLLYLVFMPFVLRFFKTDGLFKKSWQFFFKRMASYLRLSSFLLSEEVIEEEGSFYYKHFTSRFSHRGSDKFTIIRSTDEIATTAGEVFYVKDGSYVRAPNSDTVHLRREKFEFVPVTKGNKRLDGKPEQGDDSRDTVVVYLPPYFRVRIAFLLLGIWLYAASCGLIAALAPLLLGRKTFNHMLPAGQKMNDVYCLTAGAYTLCYVVIACKFLIAKRTVIQLTYRRLIATTLKPKQFVIELSSLGFQALKIVYVTFFLAFVIPALLSLVMEFYIVIPLQMYSTSGQPVIHLMQGWTLGVLYFRLLWKLLTLDDQSRWSRAYREVFAHGAVNLDVVAATKGIILPIGGTFTAALLAPVPICWIAEHTVLRTAPQDLVIAVYRFSYPMVLVLALAAAAIYGINRLWLMWNRKLLDEVYLIGEQLHNLD
ncbi:hypothetical protein V1512DRAFT_219315 [Lipomyces arxii]|uniref:uncharacterized protein n=1 Tax=Lipomyces arxii TaxID=56418 RepID=UPI0034CF3E10